MSDDPFSNILLKGIRSGQVPARTLAARKWFRNTARNTTTSPQLLINSAEKTVMTYSIVPGRMYMFFYDPKHKQTLPYYDEFPVIFPIEKHRDGFLGLNFHYLPYRERAVFMDRLYQLATNKSYDEKTKIAVSYSVVKQASRYRFFKPCIKKYLNNHVKSRLIEVASAEWDIALFLPVAQFAKQSQQQVWSDSLEKIQKVR
jgi:hypothetical protein